MDIQAMLDQAIAEEIAAYVTRRNIKHPEHKTTLAHVCKRFRLRQGEAMRILDNSQVVVLSSFAYGRPKDDSFASALMASFEPQFLPDAPLGQRLVMVLIS